MGRKRGTIFVMTVAAIASLAACPSSKDSSAKGHPGCDLLLDTARIAIEVSVEEDYFNDGTQSPSGVVASVTEFFTGEYVQTHIRGVEFNHGGDYSVPFDLETIAPAVQGEPTVDCQVGMVPGQDSITLTQRLPSGETRTDLVSTVYDSDDEE